MSASQDNYASWKLWVRERDRRYLPQGIQQRFSADVVSTSSGRLITYHLPSSDHSNFFTHVMKMMFLARYYPLESADSAGKHSALIVNNECYPRGLALVSHADDSVVFRKAKHMYSPEQGLECIPVIGLAHSSFLTRFFDTHHHVIVKKPHFWSEGRVMLYARTEHELLLRAASDLQQSSSLPSERAARL